LWWPSSPSSAAIAVPNFLRARKRSQATRVLEDLRMIDSAIDQYAIETNKVTGNPVVWNDIERT
jgi:type II secretory pathway pseudopilin PulG